MGQKVDPRGLRLKINRHWLSRWYAPSRSYASTLHEDLKIRNAILTSPLTNGGEISHIDLIRKPDSVALIINTGRPGVIIGTKGETIEKLTNLVRKFTEKKVQIKINEEEHTEINAQIVAQNVARLLKTRSTFRRVMKIAVENAMNGGALGIKVKISGRLGGAEMSRSVVMIRGRVPLHTLRADIDYGFAESFTTYGTIGVKVWIFKGEIFKYQLDDPDILLHADKRGHESRRKNSGEFNRGRGGARSRKTQIQHRGGRQSSRSHDGQGRAIGRNNHA